MGRRTSVAAILVLFIASISAAEAQTPKGYAVIDLGTLGGLFTSSTATGINNRGEVVGYSYYEISLGGPRPVVETVVRPFVYDDMMHDLGVQSGVASDINDRGQIVGSLDGIGSFIATSNGKSINVNPLVGSELHTAFATGINNAG